MRVYYSLVITKTLERKILMTNIAVGKRLKELRGNHSKEEIAYRMGISVTSVSLYETGKRMPRDEVKVKLADFYGLTVQELFFPEQGKGEKKSTCH